MKPDFSLLLVLLTGLSGLIWMIDSAVFQAPQDGPRRAGQSSNSHVNPVVIEYARSLFPDPVDRSGVSFLHVRTVQNPFRFDDPDAIGW